MVLLCTILPLAALYRLSAAEFGLAGQLFQLSGGSSVNNAKLAWAPVDGATQYSVEQSDSNGAYKTVGTTTGDTHDLYGLTVGTGYSWKITAKKDSSQIDQSNIATLTPFAPQGSFHTYDNTEPSSLIIKSDLLSNGVYYRYNYESFPNGSFSRFSQQTSSNGYDFTGDKTVLTGDVLCAPSQYSCKLERVQFRVHPGNGQFVMWSHYERAEDYALGYVAVAHTTPGQEFAFDGAYKPLGDDSRDMAFFADGETAYLITSTGTNTNNNIYSLTSNWTAVDQRLVQVNVNGHREAPSVIKSQDWFYLFTSRAAGWLPSQPQYITSRNMAGPWGNPVDVANTATFCAQSGEVHQLKNGQYEMSADQWAANWPTRGGSNRELILPVSLSPGGGFASYHFYRTVQYSDDITTQGQAIYGVQSGQIISVGKPSSASAGSQGIGFANDGVQDRPDQFFKAGTVPFWYQIDLQDSHKITEIDLTTNLVQGSETFYRFNVTGSSDETSWTLLADQSKNINPGFVASFPTVAENFRYVRINVDQIVNNVNNHEADWANGITEVTVYGN